MTVKIKNGRRKDKRKGGRKENVSRYNRILLSHKRKTILPFVTTQMDLEGIILNDINQTEKDK